MGTLVNPSTTRLGLTHFWVINYPITLRSRFPMIDKYRIQSYIYCIHKFCVWFFSTRYHKEFYTTLYLIYDKIVFNQTGFLGSAKNTQPKMQITINFFDFYFHVYFFENKHRMSQVVLNQISNVLDTYLGPRIGSAEGSNLVGVKERETLYNMLYYHAKAVLTFKRFIMTFYKKFFSLLRELGFRQAFVRIHRHFFPQMPIKCIMKVTPYANEVTAKFLAIYLERKTRTGTPVNSVLKLIYKYLRNIPRIKGFRIVISGRFIRGKKKGFVSRTTGTYSFGRYNKNHLLDYATTCADLKTGLCGFKVWLCLLPKRRQYQNIKNVL
jgi:hypothetical protein